MSGNGSVVARHPNVWGAKKPLPTFMATWLNVLKFNHTRSGALRPTFLHLSGDDEAVARLPGCKKTLPFSLVSSKLALTVKASFGASGLHHLIQYLSLALCYFVV